MTDLGLQRVGLVPFLVSTNNTADAIAHLLQATNASHLLVGPVGNMSTLDGRVSAAIEMLNRSVDGTKREGKKISAIPWPSAEIFEKGEDLAPRPLEAYDAKRVTVILHSSGTSSLYPKPIIWRQEMLRVCHQLPFYRNTDPFQLTAFLGHLPPFHAMSSVMFHNSIGSGYKLCFDAPSKLPRLTQPVALLETMVRLKIDLPILPGALIEASIKQPTLVQYLQSLRNVFYGGGPLSLDVAKELYEHHGVKCTPFYGTTEVTAASSLLEELPDGEIKRGRWASIQATPAIRYLWRPVQGETEGSEYREMLIAPKGKYYTPAVINTTYEGVEAYATGDKCKVYFDSTPERYEIHGRIDDGIVLSSGEKTNATPIVDIVKRNELVRDAIMFGTGKPMNGILIELEEAVDEYDGKDDTLAKLRSKVWPSVQEANAFAPTHSRT